MNSSDATLQNEGLLASSPSTTFAISTSLATLTASNSTAANSDVITSLSFPNSIKNFTLPTFQTENKLLNFPNENTSSALCLNLNTTAYTLSTTSTSTLTFSNPTTASFTFSDPSTFAFSFSNTSTSSFSNQTTNKFTFSKFSSPTFSFTDTSTTFTFFNQATNKFAFPNPPETTFTFSNSRAPISSFWKPMFHCQDVQTKFENPLNAKRNNQRGTSCKFFPLVGSDFTKRDGISTEIQVRHQNITTMKEYENKSVEELRLEDQLLNKTMIMNSSDPVSQNGDLHGSSPSTVFASSISTDALRTSSTTTTFSFSNPTTPISSFLKPSFKFSDAHTTTLGAFRFGAKKNFEFKENRPLHVEASIQTEEKFCINKLLQGLEEMLLDGKYSDFILNVKGKEFKVHKIILSAHSAVFSAIIERDATENATGIATINDFDPDIFSNLVNFLYTGKIEDINSDNVLDLYEVANKYQVKELCNICLKYMMNNISIDNFCDILLLSLHHHVKELTEVVTQFFLKNSKEIALTPKWTIFLTQNPIIGNELFLKVLNL